MNKKDFTGNDSEKAHELATNRSLEQIAVELNIEFADGGGKVLSRGKVFTWWRVLLSILVLLACGVLVKNLNDKPYDFSQLANTNDFMFYGLDEDEFDYEAQWKSDPTNQEYF